MRFPYDDDNYTYADEQESGSDSDQESGSDSDQESGSDSAQESGSDSAQETLSDQIYDEEHQNDNTEKTTGSYYIGSVFQDQNYAVLGLAVSARTFYNYDLYLIEHYLYEHSHNLRTKQNIDIIELNILPDLTYACVLKTHWLRIVQIHWKRTFASRKAILEKRQALEAIHYFELLQILFSRKYMATRFSY